MVLRQLYANHIAKLAQTVTSFCKAVETASELLPEAKVIDFFNGPGEGCPIVACYLDIASSRLRFEFDSGVERFVYEVPFDLACARALEKLLNQRYKGISLLPYCLYYDFSSGEVNVLFNCNHDDNTDLLKFVAELKLAFPGSSVTCDRRRELYLKNADVVLLSIR